MKLGNYTPGFIDSYDQATRICRVRIPGVTDGAEVFPEAQFSYRIGDRSERTETLILPGDRVWLDFINGDKRFPIITGYRNKESDNAIDVLRMEQKNIEVLADTNLTMTAADGDIATTAGGAIVTRAGSNMTLEAPGNITIKASSITLDGPVTATMTLLLQGLFTFMAGSIGFGRARINGFRIDELHAHTNIKSGTDVSGNVNPGL